MLHVRRSESGGGAHHPNRERAHRPIKLIGGNSGEIDLARSAAIALSSISMSRLAMAAAWSSTPPTTSFCGRSIVGGSEARLTPRCREYDQRSVIVIAHHLFPDLGVSTGVADVGPVQHQVRSLHPFVVARDAVPIEKTTVTRYGCHSTGRRRQRGTLHLLPTCLQCRRFRLHAK